MEHPRQHRCDANIGYDAGAFGFTHVICQQTVGTRTFISTSGLRVAYCAIDGHEANVRRRFLEGRPVLADPEWPGDLPVEPEEKTWTDAGWTESELREAFSA